MAQPYRDLPCVRPSKNRARTVTRSPCLVVERNETAASADEHTSSRATVNLRSHDSSRGESCAPSSCTSPAMSPSKRCRCRRSWSPRTPLLSWRPPASAARTCGPTVVWSLSTRSAWATSTSEQSSRWARPSRPSSPATSSWVPSAFPAASARSAVPATPRAARPPPPRATPSSAPAPAAPRPSTREWPSRTAP